MAIKKDVEVKGGVSLGYWRLYRFSDINYNTGKFVAVIVGYISKDVRTDEPDGFLSSLEFVLDVPIDNEIDWRQYAYSQIMSQENSPFIDGIIC